MHVFFISLFAILTSAFFVPHQAFAQPSPSSSERISSMTIEAEIHTNGTVEFLETITYDFGTAERHGIFRTIPTDKTNEDGKVYRMKIDQIEVTDENGEKYPFEKTRSGDAIELKIGDADTTISGVHVYKIHYVLGGALTYFQDVDELYWNAVGTGWEVPIETAVMRLKIPSDVNQENMQYTCFFGESGSSDKICSIDVKSDLVIYTASNILPHEGLTVALRFPSGVIMVLEPELVVNFFDTLLGKLTLVGIFLGLLSWYILYPIWIPIRWFLHGRDPEHQGVGVVTAAFAGPKLRSGRVLTPIEVGAVIDEKIQLQELSALIVHLAQKGFFTIVEKKKNDFELHKSSNPAKKVELMKFEEVFLTELFSGKTSVRIKDESVVLSGLVPKIEKLVYEQLISDGLFPKDPKKIRTFYAVITGLATASFNILLVISAAVFGRIMPRKTLEGVHAANVAKSLKNFLTSQEKQLEFQAEKQFMFEKLLPFAIAFGVEKIWAKRFEDFKLTQPGWYKSSNSQVFTAYALSSSLHGSFANSLRSAATPTSSSSGFSSGFSGGSVGGGGGGGGGGSW